QALPYGGIPSSALNRKMEKTDPLLIDAIAQVDAFHDQEDYYTDYARGRSLIGVVDPIRHPELSLGFLGNDLRGNQVGPDINKISKQMQRRKTGLTIGMGTNADTQIHNQLKGNTHVFSTQKEGKINEVTSPSETNYAGRTIMRNPEEWQKILSKTKLPVQKYGKVPSSYSTPKKDRNIMLQKPDQSWNLQQYTNITGLYIAPPKDRNIMLQKSDQSWGLQQDVNETRHILFNMYMVLATKGMVQTKTEFVLPSGFEKSIPKNSRELILPSNPYSLSEMQHEDQQRHLSLQDLTSHAETFQRPILASDLYPMNEMQREEQERHLTLQDKTSHIGTFWKPIFTSDLYSISEMQREEQERHLSLQDITSHSGTFRGPILPTDLEFLYRQQQEEQNRDVNTSLQKSYLTKGMLPAIYPEKAIQDSLITDTFSNAHLANIAETLPKSAGADQYNIHVYSSAPPQISTERSNPDTLWQHTYENSPISGSSLPEWRSHTDDTMALGNSTETVFRSNVSGGYGTVPTGPKTLRAYKESDSMNLHDELVNSF
ncbi:7287_t:CDS:2, partial [Diversispora eburnea]